MDWSLRGMAIAELIALRQQIPAKRKQSVVYTPKDRSLANTLRVLRKCMRNLGKPDQEASDLLKQLSNATVQRYNTRTDKRARYRPKNPDIKPLGDPVVRPINEDERKKLQKYAAETAT